MNPNSLMALGQGSDAGGMVAAAGTESFGDLLAGAKVASGDDAANGKGAWGEQAADEDDAQPVERVKDDSGLMAAMALAQSLPQVVVPEVQAPAVAAAGAELAMATPSSGAVRGQDLREAAVQLPVAAGDDEPVESSTAAGVAEVSGLLKTERVQVAPEVVPIAREPATAEPVSAIGARGPGALPVGGVSVSEKSAGPIEVKPRAAEVGTPPLPKTVNGSSAAPAGAVEQPVQLAPGSETQTPARMKVEDPAVTGVSPVNGAAVQVAREVLPGQSDAVAVPAEARGGAPSAAPLPTEAKAPVKVAAGAREAVTAAPVVNAPAASAPVAVVPVSANTAVTGLHAKGAGKVGTKDLAVRKSHDGPSGAQSDGAAKAGAPEDAKQSSDPGAGADPAPAQATANVLLPMHEVALDMPVVTVAADAGVAALPARAEAASVGVNHAALPAEVAPQPMAPIQTARLIQGLGQTEMRVGMRSTEFGNISIRTSSAQDVMSAQISVDHGDLAKVLTTHIPEMQAKLGTGVSGSVQVDISGGTGGQAATGGEGSGREGLAQGQADGSSGGRQQGSAEQGAGYFAQGSVQQRYAPATAVIAPGNVRGSARLDVRV